MDISIKDLLKRSTNIKTKLISNNKISWLVQVSGEYKDMSKEDKGFNSKQLSQLASLINELVPPIVVNIIHQEVPPIVETIVDQKLEPLRNDINTLKQEARNHGWNV